jgi:hypothetical protein
MTVVMATTPSLQACMQPTMAANKTSHGGDYADIE